MTTPKRYDLVGDYDPMMYPMNDGDYVRFEDYEALEKEKDARIESLEEWVKTTSLNCDICVFEIMGGKICEGCRCDRKPK